MRDCCYDSVAVDTGDSCQHDRPVQLIAESAGLISGSALIDSGRCVWQVPVDRGQRVRLRPDVFQPGAKSMALGDGSTVDGDGAGCPWLLAVEGGESPIRVPLCSRTNSRSKSLECFPRGPQHACSVFLQWPDGFEETEFPVFVVHYEGI